MSTIRKVYLYLFSLVGLVLVISGSVQLINLGLRTFVFTQADQQVPYPQSAAPSKDMNVPSIQDMTHYQAQQTTAQRQRDLVGALAMIIVGMPVYWYHWMVVNREKQG